jgi:hypothetical protein
MPLVLRSDGFTQAKEIGAVSHGDVGPIFFRKRKSPCELAVHWVLTEDIDALYQELKAQVQTSWILWKKALGIAAI